MTLVNRAAAAAAPQPPSEATPWQAWPAQALAGVDEVGRGALFGPVFAAAVILTEPAQRPLQAAGLTDSKALTAHRRQALVPQIKASALAWGIGQASATCIDRFGIRAATELAMLRALQQLMVPPNPCLEPPSLVLVDGVLPLRLWSGPQQTLVRGDQHCLAIAAASVLAKEERDALMRRLDERFPGYGLHRHAGYGTLQHRQALASLGPTPLHRQSFLGRIQRSCSTHQRR